jgi:hypothetical protein
MSVFATPDETPADHLLIGRKSHDDVHYHDIHWVRDSISPLNHSLNSPCSYYMQYASMFHNYPPFPLNPSHQALRSSRGARRALPQPQRDHLQLRGRALRALPALEHDTPGPRDRLDHYDEYGLPARSLVHHVPDWGDDGRAERAGGRHRGRRVAGCVRAQAFCASDSAG